MNRWEDGPGRLLCECGYYFDPIEAGWKCPHCALTWPWRFIRRARAADTPVDPFAALPPLSVPERPGVAAVLARN